MHTNTHFLVYDPHTLHNAFPTHTEVKQPPLFSGFTWIGRTKLCSLSNMTALLGQPFIIDNVNVMWQSNQLVKNENIIIPWCLDNNYDWSLLHVTILDLKPQKSLSFSSAANLKYQFDVINEGQCVWKTSTMHGLFKTASINHIFITKRLIILFLWKSREHVYHFLSCNSS